MNLAIAPGVILSDPTNPRCPVPSAQQLADRYAGVLVANPLLTSAEAAARLKKVLAHGEAHARRPLVPSEQRHPRTVPIPPRTRPGRPPARR